MQLSQETINFAKSVASIMIEDGITAEDFYYMADEATEAYMQELCRRVEKMQTTYLTNPKAREAMQYKVLNDLRQLV